MTRYRRKKPAFFENNEYTGAYARISFDIISETDLGKESLRFESKIHYYEKGEGEPLLLLHGIGQSLYTFRHNIDYFAARGYRVIAPDMIGFGYSGHANIFYTVEENALAVRAFMDALKIKKAHFVGVSTGAVCALCFAAAYPKRAGKLALVSPGGPSEHYPFKIRFLTSRIGEFCFKLFLSESTVGDVLQEFYFDATLLSDEVVGQYFEPYKNKEVRETLIRSVMHFDDSGARSYLKGLQNQVLVFSGTDDRLHPLSNIRAYAQNLRFARHVRLRNCAQNVHEEKPDRFNVQTLTFLQADSQAEAAGL